MGNSPLQHRMLYEFMVSGELESHVARMRAVYRTKMRTLADALRDRCGGAVQFTEPAGGFFLWLRLAEPLKAQEVQEKALERGVVFPVGRGFFPGRGAGPGRGIPAAGLLAGGRRGSAHGRRAHRRLPAERLKMPASEAPGWHIGQAALAVDDVGAAVAFYRDTLGVPFIAQPGPNLAFFDCGGLRLMLSSGAGSGGAGCTLYFKVPDIDRRYAELRGPRRHVRRSAAGDPLRRRLRVAHGLLPRSRRQPAGPDDRARHLRRPVAQRTGRRSNRPSGAACGSSRAVVPGKFAPCRPECRPPDGRIGKAAGGVYGVDGSGGPAARTAADARAS